MDAYAKKRGQDLEDLIFTFDGQRLKPHDTLHSMDIEDGDVIDVRQDQLGC
jgi:hypothetical protein